MTTILINFRASEAEKRALDSAAKHEDRTVTDILREFCRSLPHYTPNPIPTLEDNVLTPPDFTNCRTAPDDAFANCATVPDDAFANCAACTNFGDNKKA